MNFMQTSAHSLEGMDPTHPLPSDLVSQTIAHGIGKIFDVHWDDQDFMAAFAGGDFKGLSTIQLLNEMMNNWADAKAEVLALVSAKDRAVMELASRAWKPFFEFAATFEE